MVGLIFGNLGNGASFLKTKSVAKSFVSGRPTRYFEKPERHITRRRGRINVRDSSI
jgi:hypothetical protein